MCWWVRYQNSEYREPLPLSIHTHNELYEQINMQHMQPCFCSPDWYEEPLSFCSALVSKDKVKHLISPDPLYVQRLVTLSVSVLFTAEEVIHRGFIWSCSCWTELLKLWSVKPNMSWKMLKHSLSESVSLASLWALPSCVSSSSLWEEGELKVLNKHISRSMETCWDKEVIKSLGLTSRGYSESRAAGRIDGKGAVCVCDVFNSSVHFKAAWCKPRCEVMWQYHCQINELSAVMTSSWLHGWHWHDDLVV